MAESQSGLDLSAIDRDIPPGKDFYLHANNLWIKNNPVPSDAPSTSIFEQAANQVNDHLKQIITELKQQGASSLDQDSARILALYDSFLDTSLRNDLGIKPIATDLAAINSITDKNQLSRHMARMLQIGVSVPFSLVVLPDVHHPERHQLYLMLNGLALPEINAYVGKDSRSAEIREAYGNYIIQMLTAAGHPQPEAGAQNAFDIETVLALIISSPTGGTPENAGFDPVSQHALDQAMGHFHWGAFSEEAGLAGLTEVNAGGLLHYANFDRLFEEYPLEAWKDYLTWHLVNRFSEALTEDIASKADHFVFDVLEGVQSHPSVEARALNLCNSLMGWPLGKLYIDRFFDQSTADAGREMVHNIRDAYSERLRNRTWMTEATRKAALSKLSAINIKVAYPETWPESPNIEVSSTELAANIKRLKQAAHQQQIKLLEEPVDKNSWSITPQTINAYYDFMRNEIVITAAIMQPPMFHANYDGTVTYSSLGAIVGHEMSHGFDNNGGRFDANGKLSDWWAPQDKAKFRKLALRLVKQYGNYQPLSGIKY